jgi:hypothetical protein
MEYGENREPVSNGEESSGIGSFDVGEFVVVEETADEFVDDETADDFNPHRLLRLVVEIWELED